jgi:hypothetical protein
MVRSLMTIIICFFILEAFAEEGLNIYWQKQLSEEVGTSIQFAKKGNWTAEDNSTTDTLSGDVANEIHSLMGKNPSAKPIISRHLKTITLVNTNQDTSDITLTWTGTDLQVSLNKAKVDRRWSSSIRKQLADQMPENFMKKEFQDEAKRQVDSSVKTLNDFLKEMKVAGTIQVKVDWNNLMAFPIDQEKFAIRQFTSFIHMVNNFVGYDSARPKFVSKTKFVELVILPKADSKNAVTLNGNSLMYAISPENLKNKNFDTPNYEQFQKVYGVPELKNN